MPTMTDNFLPPVALLRRRAVEQYTGLSCSSLYEQIAAGLFPPPVRIGARAVGWPYKDVESVVRAWIAGSSSVEIRRLVQSIVCERSRGFVGVQP